MRTFVTGGTGFIGTQVVRRLTQAGHETYCLVRPTSNTAEIEKLGVNLVTGDVTDKASIRKGIGDCDWIINLANIYSWWEPDKQIYEKVNVEGTRNVIGCALEAGCSKVVHVSTAYVYGRPAVSPFTEDTPVGPVRPSEYTRTKYAGDLVAWQQYEEKALPLVTIYPGAVLGVGDPKLTGRYISRFLAENVPRIAFAEAIHTYVDVRDVAEVIVAALAKEGNIGEKYLVGNYQLSTKAYNELLSEISGVAAPSFAPNLVVMFVARMTTWMADLTKKPPKLPPLDYIRVIRDGCRFDGSKVEKEFGIAYTPIRETLREIIELHQA